MVVRRERTGLGIGEGLRKARKRETHVGNNSDDDDQLDQNADRK